MANSILKLRIDDQEYDAKLKKAVQGLQHLNEVAHKGAGEMTGLEKAEVDFIKALGDMETKSRSAAGRTRELESAFKELKVIYENLNAVEKEDEGGKALAKSLETLKQRAQEARDQLNSASKALQDNAASGKEDSSILDQLASKFVINVDAIKIFNTGLTAAKAALDVAKDAFFASETNVDEWGRTVAASESLYQSFLTSLNNTDISGFLSRIDEIVTAARKAYDELDRLGTMKTIQAPAMSAQQTENERMRAMIQTGRYIAPVDGRAPAAGMKNGQLLTADQIRSIEKQLQNGMQNVVKLVGNEVKQTGKAIDAVYNRQAKELGMSIKEFRKGTSSMAEFDKRVAGAEAYNKYEREHTNTVYNASTGTWTQKRDKTVNPYESFKGWDVFRVDGDRYNQLVQLIQQRDQQAAQAYGMQSQAYRAINRAEGTTVRNIMNGGSGSGGGSTTPKTSTTKTTPADEVAKAEKRYDQAQKDYDQALQQAALELKAGTITQAEAKKKELQATETLWKAIGDAREIYDSPKLQGEQKKVETAYTDLAAEVRKAAQQMATGISGLTPEMLASGQADIKKQMQTVELGSEEYNQLADRLIDYNAVSNLMQEAVKSGLEVDDSVKEYFVEALTGPLGENIPQALYDGLVESLNEFRDYAGENPIEIDTKTGGVKESKTKESEKSDQQLQKITSSMSQVISGLQMVGIKVPESVQSFLTVMQGAMTLVQGVSSLITIMQSATVPSQIAAETANTTASVANTAALSALTAAVWANTASSFIPFANGGIVPHAADGYFVGGNRFSGDLTPIMANAGELILNKAQQSTLAQQLEDTDTGAGGQPYVTGEIIYLGLNNYLKANGYGEIVTTRR